MLQEPVDPSRHRIRDFINVVIADIWLRLRCPPLAVGDDGGSGIVADDLWQINGVRHRRQYDIVHVVSPR